MYYKMLYKWDQLRFPFIRPVFLNRRDHVFRWSQIRKKVETKKWKLWSDLVVQRNRWAYPAQNFELFHMGMVSGVLVLMGFAKVGFFMIFGPFFWPFFDGFMKRSNEHFKFRFFGLRMIPNDLARSGGGLQPISGLEKLEKQRTIQDCGFARIFLG